ncbi:MAG: methyl-accepting chemotaxis protein, partial [Leptothrix sp. (in: b-proteobacteria)]
MMKTLSIRTRLALAFGSVLLLMAACVVSGIWGLNDIYGSAQQAVSRDVQLAQHAARINVLVLGQRRHEKDFFINIADVAKRQAYKKNWDEGRELLSHEIATVSDMPLGAEDSQAVAQMQQQLQSYATGFLGVAEQVQAGQIRSTSEANTAMSAYKDAIHGLEGNSEQVNTRAIAKVNGIVARLSATRVTARSLLLGLGGACLALGLVLCVVIIGSIMRPLRSAMAFSQAIADGKLDNPIHTDRGDEMGQLLQALKAMQDSLLHSKLYYQGQIDSIGITQAVIEFTPLGVIESANENFLKTMGYTLEQIRGKHHSVFVEAAERESGEYRTFWSKLGRGEPVSGQFRRVNRAGQPVWLQGIYNPILDAQGKPFKVVKYATDITAERSAAQMNAAFKGALNKLSSCVVVADNEFKVIYLNEAGQTLMARCQADFRRELPGFDAGKLVGASMEGLYKEPAQQRSLLSGLSGTHTGEQQLGGRTVRLVANPMNDESGRRLGTVVEWVDRTEEVKIEAEVQGMVGAVTDGELTRRISLEGKSGAYLNLSTGLNGLVETVASVVQNVQGLVAAANAGDLTQRVPVQGAPGLQVKIGGGINELVENMAGVISQVKGAAEEVSRGADEISQGNTNLSQRTEEQASSLEETASSMEEMTSTVKQNADNAGQANQLAVAARDQAEKGGAVVSRAVKAMAGINEASKKIADIIGVIDEIAFQTNLLALNAAVEAARAGEQGRGFAVVATEVRNLAGRSATAAKEIKTLIKDSVQKV